MSELTRDELDKRSGTIVVEFGTSWCPHCQAIQPTITSLLQQAPQVQHVKIEDGPGRRLGRSFHVKLWPTFVFMRDGLVLGQLARPSPQEVEDGFARLVSTSAD